MQQCTLHAYASRTGSLTLVIAAITQASLHRAEHFHWQKPPDPAKQASRMVQVRTCTRLHTAVAVPLTHHISWAEASRL